MKHTKFSLFSILFWCFVFFVSKGIQTGNSERVFYYHGQGRHLCHHSHYVSQKVLFSDLMKLKGTNSAFEWCCDCIQFYAHSFGYTYEGFNIVIFVILQPAAIVFLCSWILVLKLRRRQIL